MAEPVTRLSRRRLNRATLARQLLLERQEFECVPHGVRRLVAVQAQEPASVYIALWNRLSGFDAAALDRAFREGQVVRGNMVRMTLHAIHRDDYVPFREATEVTLRSRLGDRRFTAGGLTAADADRLVPELLSFTVVPRTAAECRAWLDERLGGSAEEAWWGLRHYAPLLRAPDEDAWSFRRSPSYITPPRLPTLTNVERSDEALQHLVLRYLEGFGPATIADVALFAMVQRGRVKEAVRKLGEKIARHEGPDGKELLDVPGGLLPGEDTSAPPRLLGMWDNVLLAYTDRRRIIPEEYRKLVIRVNGDVLPTLLVDGRVVGVWRPAEAGIEATAFEPLPALAWDGLAAEALSLHDLLAHRDPDVYGRFRHWWSKLPEGERRLLPAD